MSRLGDRLRLHARERADAPAVHVDDRWWSYRELGDAATRLAAALGERGVGAGDVVAVAIDRGIEAVLALAAAALIDAVPATIDPRDRDGAARTIERLRPAAVLVADGAELAGASTLTVRDRVPALAAAPAPADPIRRGAGISHIIFTSGSTADSKGVVWSETRVGYDWMLAPATPMQRAGPGGIVVPLCTALGLQDLLRNLFHGLAVVLLDAPFRAAIERIRGLAINRLKLTPTHVEILLATAEELPRIRQVMVAAAPLATPRLHALAERFAGAQVGRSYGLTETGAATAVWLHLSPGKAHTVGRAVAFRRITVRDGKGRVLPPGELGEVVIDMPVWAAPDGYLDAPPELAHRFRNATLWTGDRGRMDTRGFLTLGPRLAEILKVGGRSVSAPRIELPLRATGADVAVVGVPDPVLGEAPAAVYVPGPTATAAALAAAATAAELREDELPRWYLARRELPRGASHKLRRGVIAAEARRWTSCFTRAVFPEHRPLPAYDLEPGLVVVDGWSADPPVAGRALAVATRSPLARLADAQLSAGLDGADAPVRFIVGPRVEPGADPSAVAAFARELIRLAPLLPGAAPALTYARPSAAADIFVAAGFAPVADHAGWYVRRDGITSPELEAAARLVLSA